MKGFKQFRKENQNDLPEIDQIMIEQADGSVELHEGRKWVSGRFDGNIGIDQPSHGVGQQHAHVYGRKNKAQIVAVNLDGTASHGTKGRLHKDDASALRDRGFDIPPDNIIEWLELETQPQLLLG